MMLLIPAFEPDEALIELLRAAAAADPDLVPVVVDDGSGRAYADVLLRRGCWAPLSLGTGPIGARAQPSGRVSC